jgi:hypothetical protein
MRIVPACVLCAFLAALANSPSRAGMLDSRRNEWAFSVNYTNQTSTATSTDVNFSWGHLLGEGYAEAGLSGTYQRLDDKTAGGSDIEASIGGPFMAWNWTPHSDTASGFLQAGIGAVGGDLHRSFNYSLDAALGVKCFVGNSAAVTLQFFYQRLGDTSVSGEKKEDLDGVAIGIALFSGRR